MCLMMWRLKSLHGITSNMGSSQARRWARLAASPDHGPGMLKARALHWTGMTQLSFMKAVQLPRIEPLAGATAAAAASSAVGQAALPSTRGPALTEPRLWL